MKQIFKSQVSIEPFSMQAEFRKPFKIMIYKLFKSPRTGWKDRAVFNPESVGEHVDAVCAIANKYFDVPDLEKMLKIHDLAEAHKKVGDIRTDKLCPKDHRWTKKDKHEAELSAIVEMTSKLGPVGKEILDLWTEYEEAKTVRAKLAHQIDKFQMFMKATEYQMAGQKVNVMEFIEHSKVIILDSTLKKLLNEKLAEIGEKYL